MKVVQGHTRRKVGALLARLRIDSISMIDDIRHAVRIDTVDCPAIVLSQSIFQLRKFPAWVGLRSMAFILCF